ncbi:hypothetical protein H4R19_000802 [Coemansia spiralis]|nr:hypothetical protein H4R19_000802 [Coemansia spiralis]
MADIERQLLAQQGAAPGSDEDGSERLRAAANGDTRDAETGDDSDSAGDAVPAGPRMTHDGPQTGVKGVLADYHHSLREQKRALNRAAKPAAAATPAPARTATAVEEDSDSEIDRILDGGGEESDRFFDEYRAKRMADQSRAAAQAGLGVLRNATPDEYVDAVDRWAAAGTHVAALLVDNGRASQRLEEYVGAEAARFPQTAFLRVTAAQCGFTDPAVVPMLLVYRHGELKHNLVRVVDSFPDPLHFEHRDVARLLDRLLHR